MLKKHEKIQEEIDFKEKMASKARKLHSISIGNITLKEPGENTNIQEQLHENSMSNNSLLIVPSTRKPVKL